MVWNKERIKNLRQKLDISQAELAHRLGCRQQTVSEWEQGIYQPANAYGKLLDQFENENFLAAQRTSWLPSSQKEKGPKEESIPEFEQDFSRSSVKEFDPAVD